MESHLEMETGLWTSDWELASGIERALQARTIGIRAHFLQKEKPSEDCYSEFPWENTELWKIL